MSGRFPLFLCFLFFTVTWCYSGEDSLSKFVRNYETLNYTLKARVKRDINQTTETRILTFTAFNKPFTMMLRQDITTVSPATQFIDDSGIPMYDIEYHIFVEGWLQGDEHNSNVQGILLDNGLFSGVFRSKEHGIYFIEPAQTYFPHPDNTFHSVIYNMKDIVNIEQYRYLLERGKKTRARPQRSDDELLENNICRLSLEADYKFRDMAGGTLNAVYLLLHHISALNLLYVENFNTSDTYHPHGIRFHIGKLRIYNKTETRNLLGYVRLDSTGFYGALIHREFLIDYCEAIFFTYTPFERGILGSAHINGACPYYGAKAENVALVTMNLENSKISSAITEIVIAHEVAHSFGAEHDSGECLKAKRKDAYVMNAGNVDGMYYNNYLFSSCSKESIMYNIDNFLRHQSHCLVNKKYLVQRKLVCRNSEVDQGEECDCGVDILCQSTEPGNCCNYNTCKLNKNAVCSVSNGKCCDGRTCDYKKAGVVCFKEDECQYSSYCFGNTSQCEEPMHKPDNTTECRNNTNVCYKGKCLGSICWKFGLERCSCQEKDDQCKICCVFQGKCRVANTIPGLKSVKTYLLPGDFCNDGVGYCDFNKICLETDTRGPLQRWLTYYFTESGIKKLTRRFWWAWLLGTMIWICCVILLVKCLSLYTPSSNPIMNAKHPARKITIRFSKRSKSARVDRIRSMNEILASPRIRTSTV